MEKTRLLFVDDEPNVLDGFKRQFRQFHVDVADCAERGLQAMEFDGPYAVVVSDLRMPGMDGIDFLARAQEVAPDTMRVMLTGNSHRNAAISAVNKGHVFGYLEKPCPVQTMTQVIDEAVSQFHRNRAERYLLSRTLVGSVELLADIMSSIMPLATERGNRVARVVRDVCQQLHVTNLWEIELAANLAYAGCITLPPHVLSKLRGGETLTEEEMALVHNHPAVGRRLIARIPRLANVAEIVGRQMECRSERDSTSEHEEQVRLSVAILRAVLDFDLMVEGGCTRNSAIQALARNGGKYDADVLEVLAQMFPETAQIRMVAIDDLDETMVLDEDVRTRSGDLLIAQGHSVSSNLKARLKTFAASPAGVREPIQVKMVASCGAR